MATEKITKEQFVKQYLTNVKLLIHNRAECYMFQRIAFDMGIKNHIGDFSYISYNITDMYPENSGKSFAVNMQNLTINDKRGIQMSSFYDLEDLKEITFDDFIIKYHKMLNCEEIQSSKTPFD